MPGTETAAGSAADTVTTVAVIGGLILVPLLGWQNANLRAEHRAIASAAANRIDIALKRTVALSALEGESLPPNIVGRIEQTRTAADAAYPKSGGAIVVVVFTPNVCGISLRQGLATLQRRKGSDMRFHALIGEQSADDRVGALLLRNAGLMPFPVTFARTELLMATLFGHVTSGFAEEPLYLRLDDEYRIVSVFEADQLRPNLLDSWLEAIGE